MSPLAAIHSLAQHWWVLLLRGIFGILFGILAFVWPGATLAAVVLIWGAYALVDGIFATVAGVKSKYGSLILLGILGILAGIITFLWPGITAITLLWVIAFWAVFAGILQVVAAIRLRKEIQGEVLWILAGVCSIALGVLLVLYPGPGLLSMIWLIGSFAIVWGVLLVFLALRLKGHRDKAGVAAEPAHSPA